MSTAPLTALPAIGATLPDGTTYCGALTLPDGTLHAIALLPDAPPGKLDWPAAMAWAESLGARLPTRAQAAVMFANCKARLAPRWHWTSETEGASSAWLCHFDDGYQLCFSRSFKGSAVAVRLIPFDPSILSQPAPCAPVAEGAAHEDRLMTAARAAIAKAEGRS